VELLRLEMERGRGGFEGARANITIADNLSLRGTCICLYIYFIQVYNSYMYYIEYIVKLYNACTILLKVLTMYLLL